MVCFSNHENALRLACILNPHCKSTNSSCPEILRKALFRGGLTPETLDVLISGADGDSPKGDSAFASWDHDTFNRPPPISVTISKPHTVGPLSPDPSESYGPNNALLSSYARATYGRTNSFGAADTSITSPDNNEHYHDIPGSMPAKSPFPVNDKRTLLFTNLSDKTTHKDLTNIIRGGRVLDVYLRNDRSATVSFVEGASEFLAFAKKNDTYMHTKRVSLISQSTCLERNMSSTCIPHGFIIICTRMMPQLTLL
jgi:hypothetical protein